MIKFRIWNKNKKRYLVADEPDFILLIKKDIETPYHTFNLIDDEYEVEFCTGIKDDNGQYVFVGDILETVVGGTKQDWNYYVEDIFQLHIDMNCSDGYLRVNNVKIIGNKHD